MTVQRDLELLQEVESLFVYYLGRGPFGRVTLDNDMKAM